MNLRPLHTLLLAALLALSSLNAAGLAQAQDATQTSADTAPDYAAWEQVARRIEAAVQTGRASDQAMQLLRDELVTWRELFLAAQKPNDVRINTLKTQISTLGPPPAEGGIEPAILTQRRDELTAQLNEALAPVTTAEAAFSRANGLIKEIDDLFRDRQTDQLLKLGPSPLNPALWPAALSDLANTMKRALGDVVTSWGSDAQRAELWRGLPLTMLLGLVAFVLLLRGRAWVIRIGAGVRAGSQGPARGVWGFVLSLGQVAAPLIGVYALVQVLNRTGILGLRGQIIADSLPLLGLSFFGAAWLGNRVFGIGAGTWSILNLSTVSRAEGRLDAALLGLAYGLSLLLERLATYETYSDATRAVLTFPLLLAASFLLVRLGRLLRKHAGFELESEDGVRAWSRSLSLIGRLLVLVGFAGPLAAAVGYTSLAENFTFPACLTLALLALVAVLHRFFTSLYGLVTGKDENGAREALIPIFASFTIILLLLPVLALIWGTRVTDLTELWSKVTQGVMIGETRISPSDFLTFLVVFGVGYALTRLVQGTLKNTILPKTKIDLGGRNAITSGVGYIGLFLAALLAITSAGLDLSSLAIVAGALSVGIGFGLQNIVSNFVSGIILLIERPISEGDWIEVGGQMGYVRDISVRSTRIETFDRSDVILPNSDLISGVVTNYTRGNSIGRVIVPVGVAYGSDTKKIESILREIAEAHAMVTVNPPPNVVFQGFGADSLDFEIRAILRDVNFILQVKSDMNHEIARRFAEEGIEVPFAQRDIYIKNADAFSGLTSGAKKSAGKKKGRRGEAAVPDSAETARAQLSVDDMHSDGSDGEAGGDGDR